MQMKTELFPAGEDVELGHILAAHSSKGFGMASIHTESIYSMISGRETTIPALGHVNLLMIDDLIPAIRNSPLPSRLSLRLPMASRHPIR